MIQSVFELGDTPAREVMVPAHRDGVDRKRQDGGPGDLAGGAQRAFPHPGDRGERRRRRRRGVPEGPRPAHLLLDQRRPRHQGVGGDAPGGVRARLQAAGRPAARDAARPQPHGAAGRRVRRDRRTGHHRGRARGDRRRDRRRVRHRRGRPGGRAGATSATGCRPGCRSRTSASCTTSSSTRTSTSTPSAAWWPSNSAASRCPAPR